ncbi:MAG: hypothetical protein ACYCTL_00170 [Acidimicrobiales bacterium]|jgi:hypothetical protein
MDDSFDLNLAAASLRAELSDVHVLLKVLADQLAEAMGDRLDVGRAGGRFRKSDEIRSLRVSLGGDQFDAELSGSGLRCAVSHFSGGIRIRSEEVEMDAWVARLLGALKAEAAHSQAARQALENILIGDNS